MLGGPTGAVSFVLLLMQCNQIKSQYSESSCLGCYPNYAQSIYHVSSLSQDCCQQTPIVVYYNPYCSVYGQPSVYDQLQQYFYGAYNPYCQPTCESKCGGCRECPGACGPSPIIIINEDRCEFKDCEDGISFDNLLALIETVMATDDTTRPCSDKKGCCRKKCKCAKYGPAKSGRCNSCDGHLEYSNTRDLCSLIDKCKNNGDTRVTIIISDYED